MKPDQNPYPYGYPPYPYYGYSAQPLHGNGHPHGQPPLPHNGYNGAVPMYAQPPVPPVAQAQASGGFFNVTNPRFVKGALIGAAAVYLLSNEKVQHSVLKSAVKAWGLLQGGVEELKERVRDAEAELHAEEMLD